MKRMDTRVLALDLGERRIGVERLSTFTAGQLMIEAGRSARKRRKRIDAVAAAVILQDYLDAQAADRAGSG